jgi:hypothetical protein
VFVRIERFSPWLARPGLLADNSLTSPTYLNPHATLARDGGGDARVPAAYLRQYAMILIGIALPVLEPLPDAAFLPDRETSVWPTP